MEGKIIGDAVVVGGVSFGELKAELKAAQKKFDDLLRDSQGEMRNIMSKLRITQRRVEQLEGSMVNNFLKKNENASEYWGKT